MSEGPRWVDREALLILHEDSLREFGGASGIRDVGLLESALARPENKFLYEPETGLHRLAAAYCFGLAKNHPFVSESMSEALVFQLEEYRALRKEIDFYIAEFRLQERNVVIAVGAIWSWLIAGHRDQVTPWLLPIVLIVGVLFRSWAMSKHMRTMSGRIKGIEKAFGVVGWESQLVQSQPWGMRMGR